MSAFSNESKNNKTYASMKVITEKDDKGNETSKHPYFIIKEKIGDQWAEKERFKAFTATPHSIELSSYKWKEQDVDVVKMQFVKDGENIQLEFNLDNGLAKNLLNTMLGCDTIGELAMSLYVNKEGYPSIGIENNGERGQWKYKHDQFPAVEKNKKGVVIDNDDYLRFMRQMVEDIKKKLPMDAPVQTSNGKITPNTKAENKGYVAGSHVHTMDDMEGLTPPVETDGSGDLPF